MTQPLPEQSVPTVNSPFGEEFFPNIQSKTPLVQLKAVSSCLTACYLGGKATPPCCILSGSWREWEVPSSLLFSRLNNPSSIRLSYTTCSFFTFFQQIEGTVWGQSHRTPELQREEETHGRIWGLLIWDEFLQCKFSADAWTECVQTDFLIQLFLSAFFQLLSILSKNNDYHWDS